MTLDHGTILGICSILFTLCSIIFLAGSIPEKIKACTVDVKRIEAESSECRNKVEQNAEKAINNLRREFEKAITESHLSNIETTKRIHARLDAISVQLIGSDGAPVFVSKTDCKDKRSDLSDQTTGTQNLLCSMLERMEKKFEKAMNDWATALTNQQSMMSEIMLIKADMKNLRLELNENRRNL